MKEYGFEYIFNPPYSPAANPIEECFAQVKRRYKKERINSVVNEENKSTEDMIEKCFNVIDIKISLRVHKALK